MDCLRIRWFSGRGIIATACAILLVVSPGCRVRDANSLKVSNQEALLSQYATEFEVLKHRQFRLQADIAEAQKALGATRARREEVVARILPVNTELAAKLRLVQRMEEDLAAAKTREAAVRKDLAAVLATEKMLRAKQASAAKIRADAATAEAEIARLTQALQAKTATLTQLKATMAELAALEARIRAQIGPGKQPPAKAKIPEKATPTKKTPKKPAPKKQPAKKQPAKKK